MNKLGIFCSIVFFVAFSFSTLSQDNINSQLNSADKNRQAFNFSHALKLYKQALLTEPQNERALDGIIEIYLYHNQLYDSARVYLERRLVIPMVDTNFIVYYKYADCLRLQEEHEAALKYYHLFRNKGVKKNRAYDEVVANMNLNIDYCQNALKNKELIYEPYIVENMGFFINSIDGEYTPVFIEKDSLLLYNARYKDYDAEMMSADNKYFENIYYFDLIESVASTFNPEIDQKNHVAVVGKTFGGDTIMVCYKNVLWFSSFGLDRLNRVIELPSPLNGYYFQPHGCFSADNQTFVFSAKHEYANLDLYISHYKDGAWTNPAPISYRINSGMDEDSPYLSRDGKTLYFSSKGHNSSGGYDFFKSELIDGEWTAPVNLGYPMNSAADDIYITWNEDGRGGYFSSNRVGGFGNMDIYTFGLLRKTIEGVTYDKDGNRIAGVSVEIKNLDDNVSEFVTSNELGEYSLLVDPEKSFALIGKKEDYFDGKNKVETFGEQGVFKVDLILEKDPGLSIYILIADRKTKEPLDSVKIKLVDNMTDISENVLTSLTGDYFRPLPEKKLNDRGSYNLTIEKKGYLTKTVTYNVLFDKEGKFNIHDSLDINLEKVELGNDLSKIVELKPIYFDLGKWAIRLDAALELDKIVKVMNDNPEMIVELGSHTDSRGSATSNQKLSEKRAKSSADYIKARITNPERITGVGYGESKITNECIDGATCSEEKHQENRRTEFIIVAM